VSFKDGFSFSDTGAERQDRKPTTSFLLQIKEDHKSWGSQTERIEVGR